jgi:hypothetical protein
MMNGLIGSGEYALISSLHARGYIDEDEWKKWILSEDASYRPKLNNKRVNNVTKLGKVIVHHHNGLLPGLFTREEEFDYLLQCQVLNTYHMLQLLLGKTVVIRFSTVKDFTVEVEKVGDIKEPPIGIVPKWLHDENRAKEIGKAVNRYLDAGIAIPTEWQEELDVLLESMRKRRVETMRKMMDDLKNSE